MAEVQNERSSSAFEDKKGDERLSDLFSVIGSYCYQIALINFDTKYFS